MNTTLDTNDGLLDKYWKQIIRPPRKLYKISDLGPEQFKIFNILVKRIDFQFTTKRNFKLHVSYFHTEQAQERGNNCLIYLHGNAGCRLEGLSILKYIIPLYVNLCIFDFAGCGLSEGCTISMGFYEKEDTKLLMQVLQEKFGKISEFYFWGRSMGAATALMLGQECEQIKIIIADSSFSNFKQLLQDLGKKQFQCLSFLLGIGINYLRSKVLEKGAFDIDLIEPIKSLEKMGKSDTQIFFVAGSQDTLIEPKHSYDLYRKYQGKKELDIFEGSHNSPRPEYLMLKLQNYLTKSIVIDTDLYCECLKQSKINKLSEKKEKQLARQQKIEQKLIENDLQQFEFQVRKSSSQIPHHSTGDEDILEYQFNSEKNL